MTKPFDRKPLGELKGPTDGQCNYLMGRLNRAVWHTVACVGCGVEWRQPIAKSNQIERNTRGAIKPYCRDCRKSAKVEIAKAILDTERRRRQCIANAKKLHAKARGL